MRAAYKMLFLLPFIVVGVSGCSWLFGGDDTAAAPPVAAADARVSVRAASLRCDTITDERSWLNCYYGAAQPARAELGLQPAPQSQQNLVPR